MVAVKSFAAGYGAVARGAVGAGAHEAPGMPKAADPQIAQYENAEPMPERPRAALGAEWRGEMPRTVWIGRDGVHEAFGGWLTADVLDG